MPSEFNNWTIKIDDDFVDRKTVENAYRFWKACHSEAVFKCSKCFEILPFKEMCNQHNSFYGHNVCKKCCEHCQEQQANIDEMRGK